MAQNESARDRILVTYFVKFLLSTEDEIQVEADGHFLRITAVIRRFTLESAMQ